MHPSRLPPVALSCGDPSGIGPEIAVKAWRALGAALPFFWIGDPAHLPDGAPARLIERPDEAGKVVDQGLPVLPHAFPAPAPPGAPAPENATAVVEVIDRAVALVKAGEASALCTCPISKKELIDHAGFTFPGHTEYLAHLTGSGDVVMMLAAAELRVVPTTIHIPIAEVPRRLTAERLETTIRIVHAALRADFAVDRPRLAVAGLNPHAGEGGLIGTEEVDWIASLCARLRDEGFDLAGPLPADTMFHAAQRVTYDAAIAMYHDQALIPIKTLAFDRGVNVTLGLSIVRTSPDHGTAFGIAGQGVANPASLIEALKMADAMARARLRDRAA